MKLSNTFEIPVGVADAWPLLLNIERLVPCMPGAELTEFMGQDSYKGKVSLRLGPVMLAFDGTARFTKIDEHGHLACMEARGNDKKGRGGAVAKVAFSLQPRDGATVVFVDTDLQLSGFIAQYGRGSGIIGEVANQLVKQFAECVSRKIAESPQPRATEVASLSLTSVSQAHAATSLPISGFALGIRALWKLICDPIQRRFRKR